MLGYLLAQCNLHYFLTLVNFVSETSAIAGYVFSDENGFEFSKLREGGQIFEIRVRVIWVQFPSIYIKMVLKE